MKNLILLAGFLIFSSSIALAQPYFKGCHHAVHAHEMKALTEAEKLELQLSAERSDTIDILNYDIQLNITDFGGRTINGFTEITFTPKLDNVNHIELNLLGFTVDSVWLNQAPIAYVNDGLFVSVDFPAMQPGDMGALRIFYQGQPTVDPSGFGGLDFQSGIAYNLGIGLGSNPYNYGRGWYPCFDNFVERATYDFTIISALPRRGHCTGVFQEEVDLGNNLVARSFRMEKQLPSYLAGVAVGEFSEVTGTHVGMNEDLPYQLLAAPGNISSMENSFQDLGGVIDALEFWFGPYAWHQVGYVTTAVGAMEHAGLIAYPTSVATEGNTFRNRRLMAHELAHHWWGNVAGIPGPSDMWFKEGNAEYSAHLITEYLFGREAFVDQVVDNHVDVMRSAHIDDEGYWPLSGIPFEHTYGTHTYNKGASMMHNLRGYMGDDNFRTAMTAVQQNLGFQSITADIFRDYLSQQSGIDLTSFFDNWLKSPGWSGFAMDKYDVTDNGGSFTVNGTLFQGRRAAPEFHTNVPVQISCYNADQEKMSLTVMASGEFSEFSFDLPWNPAIIVVNEEHTLNLAQVQSHVTVDGTGTAGTNASDFVITVESTVTPSEIFVDHYWFGADPVESDEYRISENHFWRVDGFFASDYAFTALLEYRGNTPASFDQDLVSETEDSLILAWRPNGNEPWMEYPFYVKNVVVNPNDGFGYANLSQVLKGDYVFANGDLPVASVKDNVLTPVNIFPNPYQTTLTAQWAELEPDQYQLKIIDAQGKMIKSERIDHFGGALNWQLEAGDWPKGTNWLLLEKGNQELVSLESLLGL